jgi:hypothetical protein
MTVSSLWCRLNTREGRGSQAAINRAADVVDQGLKCIGAKGFAGGASSAACSGMGASRRYSAMRTSNVRVAVSPLASLADTAKRSVPVCPARAV